MEIGQPSSAALISSRLEALCVAQQVKRSSACTHPWPEFLPVIDVRWGRRTWGPRNYFLEECASPLREEVVRRINCLFRKFSPCSLRDCRDSVPIDSYSCMDRSKTLSLFPLRSRKMDAHIFSLP